MANPRDIETEIYQRIWTLLEADNIWKELVPIGNRIRYDSIEGEEDPSDRPRADADQNSAELWQPSGEIVGGIFSDDQTFATFSPDGPCEWQERHILTFRLRLRTPFVNLAKSNALAAASRDVIRKSGPRMGVDGIENVRLRWATARTYDAENDNLVRATTNIDIIVTALVNGRSMEGT